MSPVRHAWLRWRAGSHSRAGPAKLLCHPGHPRSGPGLLQLERQFLADRQRLVVFGDSPGTVGSRLVGPGPSYEHLRAPDMRLDLSAGRAAQGQHPCAPAEVNGDVGQWDNPWFLRKPRNETLALALELDRGDHVDLHVDALTELQPGNCCPSR